MNERWWTFLDKADWNRGEWDREPDKLQWTDEATGLPCLAVRNASIGNWCGYAGVAEGHPLFQVEYSDCPFGCKESSCEHSPAAVLDVHGGITFSDACQEGNEPHGICHIIEPGQPDHVWWFGWDCGHADDLMPRFAGYYDSPYRRDVYRDLGYVKRETTRLAAQLAAMTGPV